VTVISKTGTRKFHGSAYDYYRHEDLNVNSFFNNALIRVLDTTAMAGSVAHTGNESQSVPTPSSDLFTSPAVWHDVARRGCSSRISAAPPPGASTA
jgi:hypothetical protein